MKFLKVVKELQSKEDNKEKNNNSKVWSIFCKHWKRCYYIK